MAIRTVGIMSMQRIYNYGSSLQAYGLKRVIESLDDSVNVSYLDYRPGPILVDSAKSGHRRQPTLGRVFDKVREYSRLDAPISQRLGFINHKRRYGRMYFPELGITASPQLDYNVDLQIIGSDEVFNCIQTNTRVGYSRDLFGYATPAHRIVSYAASFGNTTLNKIELAGVRSEIAMGLSQFEHISVRDQHSCDIVETLTGRVPEIHIDPVLVFPFMQEEPRVPEESMRTFPFIIVYAYSGRLTVEENHDLRRYADSVGAEILCFGGVQECGDDFIDCSPFELLGYFRDAEAVVTDTFHGTIFSIINRTPFCTIVRQSTDGHYGNEEKIGHILELFGLGHRRSDCCATIPSILDSNIDFSSLDTILDSERQAARKYLIRVLNQGAKLC